MRAIILAVIAAIIVGCGTIQPQVEKTCYAVIVSVKAGENSYSFEPFIVCAAHYEAIVEQLKQRFGDTIVAIEELKRCKDADCAILVKDLLDKVSN